MKQHTYSTGSRQVHKIKECDLTMGATTLLGNMLYDVIIIIVLSMLVCKSSFVIMTHNYLLYPSISGSLLLYKSMQRQTPPNWE